MAASLQSVMTRFLCSRNAIQGGLRCFSATSQHMVQSMASRNNRNDLNNIYNNHTRVDHKLLQYGSVAQMSYDNTNKVHKRIHDLITNSEKRVFLFMKGVPKEPMCGYSNAVVQILESYGVDFDSFNVLDDDEVRQEIKTYSEWPTIPQVYVDGNFVGGCDILIQMHQSNELEQLFEGEKKE